jgi:hypothetical protein
VSLLFHRDDNPHKSNVHTADLASVWECKSKQAMNWMAANQAVFPTVLV